MSKVSLVAGAAGFIGTNLSIGLLSRGHKVIGLDDFSSGSRANFRNLGDHKNFLPVEGSVCDDLQELEEHKFDYIFHLASPASPPKYMALPLETMDANTLGTKNLISLAQKVNGRLIYASTSEIYGDPLESPQTEGYWGNVNPIGPRSVYDESKRFGETLVAHFQRTTSLNAAIIRIFNTYGPFMDPFDGRVVSNFIRQGLSGQPFSIYGSGEQTRSFCYVDDMVSALIKVAESEILGPINLGNPNEFTLLELAEKVANAIGVGLSFEFSNLPIDDPKQRKPDITQAREKLDWEPKIQLDEGILETSKWMRLELNASSS